MAIRPGLESIPWQCSGQSRPLDKEGGRGEGGGVKKFCFAPFGPLFGLKIGEGERAPRASPRDPPLQRVIHTK